MRDHRQDVVPLAHGPLCRVQRGLPLGLGRHARRHVARRDRYAFDLAALPAQRRQGVLVVHHSAGCRNCPRVLDDPPGGEGQPQHPVELRRVARVPTQVLPGAAEHLRAVQAHRAGAALAGVDVPAAGVEGVELVRRGLQQRLEQPHAAAELEQPQGLACGGTKRVDLVGRKRARRAIEDGDHADLGLPFVERRDREEARARNQREKRIAGAARVGSRVLDHFDVLRQGELRSFRNLQSEPGFEPEPAAADEGQQGNWRVAYAGNVPDQLVRLGVGRWIGDRQRPDDRELFVFAEHPPRHYRD